MTIMSVPLLLVRSAMFGEYIDECFFLILMLFIGSVVMTNYAGKLQLVQQMQSQGQAKMEKIWGGCRGTL